MPTVNKLMIIRFLPQKYNAGAWKHSAPSIVPFDTQVPLYIVAIQNLTMRNFLLAAFLFLSTYAFATHFVGGHITYVHKSTGTTQSTYTIRLTILADASVGAISFGPTSPLYMKKSGGTEALLSVPLVSLDTLELGCNSSVYATRVYVYEKDTLLDNGATYDFYYSSCCRNYSIDNLYYPGSSGTFFKSSVTVSAAHPQSSINYSAYAVSEHTNTWRVVPLEHSNPDADSLHFELITPQQGGFTPGTGTPLSFSTGYSLSNYLGPTIGPANNLFSIDPKTGAVTLISRFTQIISFAYRVTEYRITPLGNAVQTGTIEGDQLIVFTPNSVTPNPIGITSTAVDFDTLYIGLQDSIHAYTLLQDNSQFSVSTVTGTGSAPNIKSVEAIGATAANDFKTDSLKIVLSQVAPGSFRLYADSGLYRSYAYGDCNSFLKDSADFTINFGTQLLGPTDTAIMFTPSNYSLLYGSAMDSVHWSIQNGSITTTTTNSALPVEVTWYASNAWIRAITYHYMGTDTLIATPYITSIGVDENSAAPVLYPNPANQTLRLRYSENASLEMYNSLGERVLSFAQNPGIIDVSTLPPGLYSAVITVDGRRYLQKILISR